MALLDSFADRFTGGGALPDNPWDQWLLGQQSVQNGSPLPWGIPMTPNPAPQVASPLPPPTGANDPFADRFGQWESATSPSGRLAGWQPAQEEIPTAAATRSGPPPPGIPSPGGEGYPPGGPGGPMPAPEGGGLPFGIPGTFLNNPIQAKLGDNANTLLAFAGGAYRGGIGRGLEGAARAGLIEGPENQKIKAVRDQQLGIYHALRAKGLPHADAMSAAMSPEILKAMAPEIYGNNWKFEKLDDGFGGQVPVFVNSRTQEMRDMNGKGVATGGEGTPGGVGGYNSNLVGEEYLAQFPKEVQAAVKSYVSGEAASTANPRKGFAEAVKKIGQKYSQDIGEPVTDAKYAEMLNFRRELGKTSPQSVGGQRNLAHTSISHLLQAGETFEKLKNSDFGGPAVFTQGVNAIRNAAADNARKGEIDALQGNAEKYSQEVTKFYAGGPGAVAERERTLELFNPNKSRTTMAAVLQKERDLLAGKLEALEHQKNEALGRNAGSVDIVNKQGREDLAKLDTLIARLKKGDAPAAPGAAPMAVDINTGSPIGGTTKTGVPWSIK